MKKERTSSSVIKALNFQQKIKGFPIKVPTGRHLVTHDAVVGNPVLHDAVVGRYDTVMRAMKYLFQSQRLGFRKWKQEDLVPMSALNADPEVMEFFPSTQTKEQTLDFLKRVDQQFKDYGHCWYAVETLVDGDFIGFIGLAWNNQEGLDFAPSAEIGWRLKKAAWGNGYATEGAIRCLEYGFKELKFPEIYSFTATINERSERVMQKIGMTKIGEFEHPKIEEGHVLRRHVLYHVSRT